MKLKELLDIIKDLDPELEVYIHEVDEQDRIHFKSLQGINLQVTDKKLSLGHVNFHMRMYEKSRAKGRYL